MIKISYIAPITGAAVGVDIDTFEDVLAVSSKSSQIAQHIVFDENPPLFCEDGIYIEINGKSMPFEIKNEIYKGGVCREVDVVINNPAEISEMSGLEEEIPAENITEQNLTNENITEENQTEILPENITENQSETMQNPHEVSQNPIAITGFAVSEPGAEIKIYYGSAAQTPSAEIGRDVQITYKTDSAPSLIILDYNGGISEKKVTKDELRSLAKTAKAIEKNEPISALLANSVPLINATKVWSVQVSGQNITGTDYAVCIIDTGIDYTHSDLGGCFGNGCKVLGGYDFVNNDTDPKDDNGHGSHVAGIVAANGAINGAAPNANLVAVKVLDANGLGFLSNAIKAISWCVANRTLYNITSISMSLGTSTLYQNYCDGDYPVLAAVVNDAFSNNISVIVATGNRANTTSIASPACIQNAIAVAASTKKDLVWSSSSRNSITDFLAPGENIYSAILGSGYATKNGTSMAAPHVAALVTLLQQYNLLENGAALSVSQITEAMNHGVSITDSQSGLTFKRIDAIQALGYLAPELAPPEITIQSPANGNFYGTGTIDFNITVSETLSAAFVSIDSGVSIVLLNDTATHYYNTSVLSEDVHGAVFWVNDTRGDSNTAEVSFTIDLTNPSVILASPANGSVIHKNQIVLNITDTYLSAVVYYTSQNPANTILTSPYQINTTSWTKGGIALTVIANDSAGNINQSVFAFMVSNTAPVASGVSTTPSAATTTSDLTCSYAYSDIDGDGEVNSGANRTQVQWYKNGVLQSNLANLAVIDDGNTSKGELWKCSVTPFDGTDYGTQANSTNVAILNSVPNPTSVLPNTGRVNATSISVNATVTDGDGDALSVKFYYSPNSTSISAANSVLNLIGTTSTSTENIYNLNWNLAGISDRSYKIVVNASDGTNHTLAQATESIIVNNINEPPTVTVIYPNGNKTLSGTEVIEWSASDPDSDVLDVSIYYSANGGTSWNVIINSTANNGHHSWNTVAVSNGANYRINVTVRDPNGLTASDISDSSFTVTNSAPSSGGTGAASSVSGGGGLGGITYDITQKFTLITTSAPATFAINKEEIALTEMILNVNQAANGAEVKIKKLSDKPADISIAPGNVYQYLQIDTLNLTTLSTAVIKFKIPKTWVQENSIDSKTAALKKWTGSAWITLSTTLEKEDDANYHYIATATSFSVFAVTGNKIETPVQSLEDYGTEQPAATPFGSSTGAFVWAKQFSMERITLVVVISAFVLAAIMLVGTRKIKPKPQRQQYYPPQRTAYYQQPQQRYFVPRQVYKKPEKKDAEPPDFGF